MEQKDVQQFKHTEEKENMNNNHNDNIKNKQV